MQTKQLWKIGKKLIGDKFLGVFPLDRIPYNCILQYGSCYITNTQTSNLPGQHWIAIYANKMIHVFDPLGAHYPPYLVRRLQSSGRPICYHWEPIQDPNSTTCGQHCLIWLISQGGTI